MKQETAGGHEEEKRPSSEPIIAVGGSSAFEHMYTTVAAGMVADELPKDLVNKFLEAIQEGEHTIYHGIAPPQ